MTEIPTKKDVQYSELFVEQILIYLGNTYYFPAYCTEHTGQPQYLPMYSYRIIQFTWKSGPVFLLLPITLLWSDRNFAILGNLPLNYRPHLIAQRKPIATAQCNNTGRAWPRNTQRERIESNPNSIRTFTPEQIF